MAPSKFIRAMHPKTEILPEMSAITRILAKGWVGQLKIHGHRAQIHIPADPNENIIAYTRQGRRHTAVMPPKMVKEILRLFRPETGWNVIDAEWLKPAEKLFVFDVLKWEGALQRHKTYPERWNLLPTAFISPHVSILPMLSDIEACQKALASCGEKGKAIEGLVFKSTTSTGFSDTSIVRCRKRK